MTSQGNYELSGLPSEDPLEAWLSSLSGVESSSAKGVSAEAALGAELFQDVLKGAGDLSRAP
jgi:hypothetical protein